MGSTEPKEGPCLFDGTSVSGLHPDQLFLFSYAPSFTSSPAFDNSAMKSINTGGTERSADPDADVVLKSNENDEFRVKSYVLRATWWGVAHHRIQ